MFIRVSLYSEIEGAEVLKDLGWGDETMSHLNEAFITETLTITCELTSRHP